MTGWVFLWLALWTFLPFSGIMVSDQYQDYLQTFRKGVLFMANIHDEHRQRLRKRFLQEGLSSFEPHQVLELLTYAIPRKDVNPTAHDLLNTFGTIDKVFDAPFNALTKIDGVGDVTASLLKLVPELSACYIDSKNKGMKVLDTTEKLKEFLIPGKNRGVQLSALPEQPPPASQLFHDFRGNRYQHTLSHPPGHGPFAAAQGNRRSHCP